MLSPRTKYEHVYQTLVEQITSGELQPGDRLQIKQIADEVGSSEIPVREAISRLAAEGLIIYRPHQGAVVLNLAPVELRELMVLKAVLEAVATRLSAPHVTPALLREMEETLSESESYAQEDDSASYATFNRRFHATLYTVCPSQTLVAQIAALHAKLDLQRHVTIFSFFPDRRAASVHEHRLLLALFRGTPQDLDRIEALARWHKLQNVRRLAMAGSQQLCDDLVTPLDF